MCENSLNLYHSSSYQVVPKTPPKDASYVFSWLTRLIPQRQFEQRNRQENRQCFPAGFGNKERRCPGDSGLVDLPTDMCLEVPKKKYISTGKKAV